MKKLSPAMEKLMWMYKGVLGSDMPGYLYDARANEATRTALINRGLRISSLGRPTEAARLWYADQIEAAHVEALALNK